MPLLIITYINSMYVGKVASIIFSFNCGITSKKVNFITLTIHEIDSQMRL
jgi:hypothetical protein